MKPLVDISRVGRGAYTYVVGTGAGACVTTRPDGAFGMLEFASLESCLSDLGDALQPYFPRVDLQFAGRSLGSCSTTSLRGAPAQMAARIRESGIAA